MTKTQKHCALSISLSHSDRRFQTNCCRVRFPFWMMSGFCTLLVYLLLLVELGTDVNDFLLCIFQPIRHKYIFAFEIWSSFLTLGAVLDQIVSVQHNHKISLIPLEPRRHGNDVQIFSFLLSLKFEIKKFILCRTVADKFISPPKSIDVVAVVKLSILSVTTWQTQSAERDGEIWFRAS